MKNQNDSASELPKLRQRAEKQLQPTVPISQLSEAETQKLFHELQVHQIELELQNEELQKAVSAAEDADNLYDFAPVGYFTLSPTGEIVRLNFNGAEMLGKDRSGLIRSNFKLFISNDTRSVFNAFLDKIFRSKVKESCEVIVLVDASEPMYVQLDGIATKSGEQCLLTGIDITDRKKAEQTLFESEKRYRLLLENSMTGILITRPDGAILAANPEACRLLGRTETEICQIGRDGVVDLTNPNLSVALEKRQQTGHFHGELTYLRADGTVFPVENESGIFTDSDGQTYAYNFFQDITERKQNEKILQESEANIQAIFNATNESIFLINVDETLLAMNEIAAQRIGQPKEKLIGKKIVDWLPAEVVTRRRPFFDHALQTGEIVRFEDERNGCSFATNLYPILDSEGNVIRLAVYSSDITERKRAEDTLLKSKRQYDDLVAKIPVGVYILHTKPDGAFVLDYVSPRMAEMLSLSVESLLSDNQTIYKAIHPDDLEGFKNLSREGILVHRPFNWKGRIVADGNVKWMHFRSTPEPLENGDMLWHGLIVDITERVNADQEISLKNEELSSLVAEKDKFFSVLAHDLRSPFNSILGFTQMLDDDLPTMEFDQIKQIASVLRNSAFSAYSLLENLLAWSRMKRGNTSYKPETFKLRSKIEESLQSVMELATKKWIEVSLNVSDDLQAMADENMFGSIIRNLATNAIKFTPKYGTVLFSAQVNDDKNIEISVKDSGIGMNQSILNKLFSHDEDINRKGTEGEASSGLGLIICKEFVEKHGGRIWAESEVGKGSTFYLTLPQYIKV